MLSNRKLLLDFFFDIVFLLRRFIFKFDIVYSFDILKKIQVCLKYILLFIPKLHF